MKILILEDDAQRHEAMRDCLTDRVVQFDVLFAPTASVWFRAVPDAIDGAVHRGLDDIEAGRTHDMDEVFGELDETYGRADAGIVDQ